MGKLSGATNAISLYLKDVLAEMKHIIWPSRADVVKHTILVIVFSVAVALFLAGLDFVFNYGIDALLNIK